MCDQTSAGPSIQTSGNVSDSKVPCPRTAPTRWRRWRTSLLWRWRTFTPQQQLLAGFISYVILGVAALSLPMAQELPVRFVDNLFSVVSAISTTGLATVATGESYTFFGELVHVVLFQLGGIGYMTLTSFILIAGGRKLSGSRRQVLGAGFTLPHYFRIDRFILHVVVFTLVAEAIGVGLLWVAFSRAGVETPFWWAVFHTVSAFATAGFGLSSSSLEAFRDDWLVNVTIAALSYLGAVGFIVLQDVYYSFRYRERMITFTSKVILSMTAAIFVLGTAILFFVEPEIRQLDFGSRLMASAFQVMTASSTAGFNTIPIGPLSLATLWLIVLLMLIGASPSGTGGGMKTTAVSALFGCVVSVVRGRNRISLLGNEIPATRLIGAIAATAFYLVTLAVGVLLLAVTESGRDGMSFQAIVFEAASGLGTVGLSMGVTASLSEMGKWVLIVLMFLGRIGPLTLGIALARSKTQIAPPQGVDDLAT